MEQQVLSATKTNKRVIKTKMAIKLALTEIMKKKNIYEITVSELVKKANVGRKTFYCHYPNIQAVFEEIEDDIINNFREILIKHKSSNFQDTAIYFTATDKLMKDNYEIYSNLFKLDCSANFMNKLKSLIKEISFNGVFNNTGLSTEHREIITEFLASGFVALIKIFYLDKSISTEVMVNTSSRIVKEITDSIRKAN